MRDHTQSLLLTNGEYLYEVDVNRCALHDENESLFNLRVWRRTGELAILGLIYLDVDVDCLVREVGNPIFDIDVHLGIEHLGIPGVEDVGNHPFDSLFLRALLDENYGAFGVGDGEYILEAIEESVEDAVTVFILAHME